MIPSPNTFAVVVLGALGIGWLGSATLDATTPSASAPAAAAQGPQVCVAWKTRLGTSHYGATAWEPIGVVPKSQTTNTVTKGLSVGAFDNAILGTSQDLTGSIILGNHAILYRACFRYGTPDELLAALNKPKITSIDQLPVRRTDPAQQKADNLTAQFEKLLNMNVIVSLEDGTRLNGVLQKNEADSISVPIDDEVVEIDKADVVSCQRR